MQLILVYVRVAQESVVVVVVVRSPTGLHERDSYDV
jgi:hypothetical protein